MPRKIIVGHCLPIVGPGGDRRTIDCEWTRLLCFHNGQTQGVAVTFIEIRRSSKPFKKLLRKSEHFMVLFFEPKNAQIYRLCLKQFGHPTKPNEQPMARPTENDQISSNFGRLKFAHI